jgi:hypothetical protein
MTTLGADVEQLERFGRLLERQATTLREAGSNVSRLLEATPWRGRDADRFRGEWAERGTRELVRAAEQLEVLAREVRRQAADQRAASGEMTVAGAHPGFIGRALDVPTVPGGLSTTLGLGGGTAVAGLAAGAGPGGADVIAAVTGSGSGAAGPFDTGAPGGPAGMEAVAGGEVPVAGHAEAGLATQVSEVRAAAAESVRVGLGGGDAAALDQVHARAGAGVALGGGASAGPAGGPSAVVRNLADHAGGRP